MARRAFILAAFAGLALAAAAPTLGARGGGAGAFRLTGTIVRAFDGDTVEVRIAGRLQRVGLVGVAAPKAAAADCFAAQATDRLAALASGRRATLRGDSARSVSGARRILAYVDYAGGDLGQKLIAGGFARVDAAARPFKRAKAYAAAEAAARTAGLGLWTACAAGAPAPEGALPAAPAPAAPAPAGEPPAPPAPPPSPAPAPEASPPPPPPPPDPSPAPACDPSYPSLCVAPPPPSLSCGDIGEKDFPVRHDVPNADPHGFDGDGNGIGCQSPCPKTPVAPPASSTGTQAYRWRPGRRRRRP